MFDSNRVSLCKGGISFGGDRFDGRANGFRRRVQRESSGHFFNGQFLGINRLLNGSIHLCEIAPEESDPALSSHVGEAGKFSAQVRC